MAKKFKIKKGDQVVVITGRDRGKQGPIHISNVAHLDPASRQPTRAGYKFLDEGRKVRFAKRSGEVIDR
jgi:large subunit ribosomal protein L24